MLLYGLPLKPSGMFLQSLLRIPSSTSNPRALRLAILRPQGRLVHQGSGMFRRSLRQNPSCPSNARALRAADLQPLGATRRRQESWT